MRRILFYLLFCTTVISSFGQDNLEKETAPIVAEGKKMYRSEMASLQGTILFMNTFKQHEKIGGYFSYAAGDSDQCIYFSNDVIPIVLATICFDSAYDTRTARIDLSPRSFTAYEQTMYTIRKLAFDDINTDPDKLYAKFDSTEWRVVPLVDGDIKKVYVLTRSTNPGIAIIGNDYLLRFNRSDQLILKRKIHRNIQFFQYGSVGKEGKALIGGGHSHVPETGEFMTSTDVCTIMLYEKLAKWEMHIVVSEKYMSTWNCKTNTLVTVPKDPSNNFVKFIEGQNKKD